MSDHLSLYTYGQHNLVHTHKFLGRYSNCFQFSTQRSVKFSTHRVCRIVAATPWVSPLCMIQHMCTTTIKRNKFEGWATTPMRPGSGMCATTNCFTKQAGSCDPKNCRDPKEFPPLLSSFPPSTSPHESEQWHAHLELLQKPAAPKGLAILQD